MRIPHNKSEQVLPTGGHIQLNRVTLEWQRRIRQGLQATKAKNLTIYGLSASHPVKLDALGHGSRIAVGELEMDAASESRNERRCVKDGVSEHGQRVGSRAGAEGLCYSQFAMPGRHEQLGSDPTKRFVVLGTQMVWAILVAVLVNE